MRVKSQVYILFLFLFIFHINAVTAVPVGRFFCFESMLRLSQDERSSWESDKNSAVEEAKRTMNISRGVSKKILGDPKYGPELLQLLEAVRWIESEEGREVIARTAQLIKMQELHAGRQFADVLKETGFPGRYFEALFATDRETLENSTDILSDRQAIREGERLSNDLDVEYRKALSEMISPAEILVRAAKQIADEHPERQATFRAEYAPLLMGSYIIQGSDIIKPINLVRFIFAETKRTLVEDRIRRGHLAAIEVAGGGKAVQNLFKRIDPALRAAGYDPKKAGYLPYITFSTRILTGPIQSQVLMKLILSDDIENEINHILDQSVQELPLDKNDAILLKRMLKTEVEIALEDYLPARYIPISSESLTAHQMGVLGIHGRRLVQTYAQERDREARSAINGGNGMPAASNHLKQKTKPPTRQQRIEAYRAEKERKLIASALQGIEKKHPETIGFREAVPQQSPVSTTHMEIPEEQLERTIGVRAISTQRAENILNFYGTLSDSEKVLFRKAVGQLLNQQTRRLADVVDGRIERLAATSSFYELKIQGNTQPIRVYFGIDPEEGPMLFSAHYKKSDADQARQIETLDQAWKKYIGG